MPAVERVRRGGNERVGIDRAFLIAAAVTPNGTGYWIVQTDGTVTVFGNAKRKHGAGVPDAAGIASTPSGKGYWIATRRAT